MLSLFAIRNPQNVKRALQKVTDFIRFLQSCTSYHGKSKNAKSFSIVKGSLNILYSVVNTCVYTQTSIRRAAFILSCIIKALHKPTKPTLQLTNTVSILITFMPNHTLANTFCLQSVLTASIEVVTQTHIAPHELAM